MCVCVLASVALLRIRKHSSLEEDQKDTMNHLNIGGRLRHRKSTGNIIQIHTKNLQMKVLHTKKGDSNASVEHFYDNLLMGVLSYLNLFTICSVARVSKKFKSAVLTRFQRMTTLTVSPSSDDTQDWEHDEIQDAFTNILSARCPQMTSLSYKLRLRSCVVRNILVNVKQLRHLRLDTRLHQRQVYEDTIPFLTQNSLPNMLRLHTATTTHRDILNIQFAMRNLSFLEICGRPDAFNPFMLSKLKPLPLVELRLSVISEGHAPTYKRWKIIENIGILTNLRVLQLQCRMKNVHCNMLSMVCRNIKSLDVHGNRFDINGLQHLSNGMQELEELTLGVRKQDDKICIEDVNIFFKRQQVFCKLKTLEIQGVKKNNLTVTNLIGHVTIRYVQ